MPPNLRIPQDQIEFLKSLVKANVRFVVIGGYAVRFFGCDRETTDLDILIDSTEENAIRLRPLVVDYLGYEPTFVVADLLKHQKQLKTPDRMIDILTSVEGLEFGTAYQCREQYYVDGVLVPFVSKDHLIFIKEAAIAADATRGELELGDIECLKSKHPHNKSLQRSATRGAR